MRKKLKDQQGQAVIEYIVLLAIVLSFYAVVSAFISKLGLERKIQASLFGPFASLYKYGHYEAQGYDEGAPKMHPRIYGGDRNFRIFLNPKSTQ
jgi:hypothetical protein